MEAFEIGGIAGMIDGMPAGSQNEASEAAMHIPHHARAPMARRRVGHFHAPELEALPPVELDNAPEPQVAYQVANVPGHDNDRPLARLAAGEPSNRPQRRTVQVVKV